MVGAGTGAALLSVLDAAAVAVEPPATSPEPGSTVAVDLTVNGDRHRLHLDPRATLLDTLRERLALTGSKKGCDHGQCGACTAHVDGRRVLSCLTLAAAVRGRVTTIEGLAARDGTLHPMRQAFIDHAVLVAEACDVGLEPPPQPKDETLALATSARPPVPPAVVHPEGAVTSAARACGPARPTGGRARRPARSR